MGSRMRKNKSQRDQRRSHLQAKGPRVCVDTETGSTHLRHRVDLKTGMYRGRQVLNTANDSDGTTSQSSKADKETAETAS